jgi:transposase InsO family protein
MSQKRLGVTNLPKGWKLRVRSAVVNVISLAKYSLAVAHGQAINRHGNLRAECERLEQEVLGLREELRIKDARMAHLPPHRRPHYPPGERMAILELRAARGWSLAQTARAFLVTEATISSWLYRLDEQGPNALVALREPVNKFPEFVHYLVRRLRALCPTLGKVKMAQTLARAGLHLGATTVGRMLKEHPRPAPVRRAAVDTATTQVVTARFPNHVWHIDLTTVPTMSGFWVAWTPLSLPQRWPFCWWVAVIVDHFSRRVMGLTVFAKQPTGQAVREFLSQSIRRCWAQSNHLISDKGRQFHCAGLKRWCRRREIHLRFGAVGQHGSIAVIERFILTLKQDCAQWPIVLMKHRRFENGLHCFADWYNDSRPHTRLQGRTPNEVYHRRFPNHRRPRYESRQHWPRGSPSARPWALARNRPGARLELKVAFRAGRRDLPIVAIHRAA